jgi:hypothetical protein
VATLRKAAISRGKTIRQDGYGQEEDIQRTAPRLLEVDMRISIQAVISDVEGRETRTEDIGV